MGRVNGFGLALKAPRKLAGGKPSAPPPETRFRVAAAPAGRRQPGSRCFRRPFRTQRLRPQYRGRRPPRRPCPRLISMVALRPSAMPQLLAASPSLPPASLCRQPNLRCAAVPDRSQERATDNGCFHHDFGGWNIAAPGDGRTPEPFSTSLRRAAGEIADQAKLTPRRKDLPPHRITASCLRK